MSLPALGQLLHAYFADHLVAMKGLRPSTIRSYRDTVRLYLLFVANDRHRAITRLLLDDLTFERTLAFLHHLENVRGNHPRTRNQRLAALHGLFDFLAGRAPEILHVSQRVAAIPSKRAAPAEIRFLDRAEISAMLGAIPSHGRRAERDRALLLFLYNTGARAQEVCDLRRGQIDFGDHARVRLCGKGGKWRSCPLWAETTQILRRLCDEAGASPSAPVFTARAGQPLTRFGIYKIVRRRARVLEGEDSASGRGRRVSPHILRHSTAVHLLESGVDMNVIRTWLGHAQLETTYRYAEITMKAKEEALRACEVPDEGSAASPARGAWRNDEALLSWLASL